MLGRGAEMPPRLRAGSAGQAVQDHSDYHDADSKHPGGGGQRIVEEQDSPQQGEKKEQKFFCPPTYPLRIKMPFGRKLLKNMFLTT